MAYQFAFVCRSVVSLYNIDPDLFEPKDAEDEAEDGATA